MENTQSVQQPSETQAPAAGNAEKENNEYKPRASENRLVILLAYYPWLLIGGVLAVFAGCAAIALYSLHYVGRVESTESEAIQEIELEEQPITTSPQTTTTNTGSNALPLWMVIAIAMSCASGCWVILKLLNRSPQEQAVKSNTNRRQSRLVQRRQQKLELSTPKKNLPVFVPPSSRKSFETIPTETNPTVTVIPPEENFNQKDKEESLASMMDIRKQTSLSALLRKD